MSRSTPRHLANRRSLGSAKASAERSRDSARRRSAIAFALRTHALALLAGVALSATQASAPAADAAFSSFFQARSAPEAAAAADRIVASGVGFAEAFARLRPGRTYSRDVPRRAVQANYRGEAGEYF